MASNYPAALDTTTELPNDRDDDTLTAANHPDDHNNLSDAVRAVEGELGTDPAGASADVKTRLSAIDTALAGKQASDADLTALAALTTTAYGRALLELADAAAGRTALGLGTAATHAHGDYDAAGAAAAAQAASQPLDSDLTAVAGISPTNDDVIQRKSGAWVARSMSQIKTDLALAKGDVGLGNVDNTSDAGKPVSTAQQAALDARTAAYRTIFRGTSRASTGAAAGTKYFVLPTADTSATSPQAAAHATSPVFFNLVAADYAISGKTTKLRVTGLVAATTNPAITVTIGLYPVTMGASLTLGTLVSGSGAAVTTAANTIAPGVGSDFDFPTDGVYALGWVVSGTPSAIFNINSAELQLHWA